MDKSQIQQALIEKLSGSNWDRVKDSTIGKELIAFGTEVINECASVQDSLVNAFDYRTTDVRGLISLSHVQEVGLSFQRPAYVKVQLNIDKIIRPFGIKFSVGNITFYNIETVDTKYEVTLYQGVLTNTYKRASSFKPIPSDVMITPEVVEIPKDSTTSDTLYVLGQAMPDSVLIYIKDSAGIRIMDKATALNLGPTKSLYKPYVLYDGRFAVMMGDDVWAAKLKSSTYLAIYWLKPDFSSVEFEIGSQQNVGVYLDGSSTIQTVQGTILEYYQGSSDDIEYARSFYQREYLQRQAISSKEQIHEWMNSHVDVLDSSVVAIDNHVYVYIKPKSQSSSEAYYEKYMADLNLYGLLFMQYSVLKGTKVKASLEIVTLEPVTTAQKELANASIREAYSYESMKFSDGLDTSKVAFILSELGIQGIVYVHGEETIKEPAGGGSPRLSFAPIRGSLRIYDAWNQVTRTGLLVAWDSNGAIKGTLSTPTSLTPNTDLVNANLYGDFLVSGSSTFVELFKTSDFIYAIQFSGADLSAYDVWTSNGYAVVMDRLADPITFNVVDIDAVDPDSLSLPPYYATGLKVGTVDSCMTPRRLSELIVDGVYLYKALIDTGQLSVGVYSGTTTTPDYVKSMNCSDSWIAGSYVYVDDIYIFSNKQFYLFRNIRTYAVSVATGVIWVDNTQISSSDDIESIHVYDNQQFALIVIIGGVRKLYYGSVIRVADNKVEFISEGNFSLADVTGGSCVVARNNNNVFVYKIVVDPDTQAVTKTLEKVYYGNTLITSSIALYTENSSTIGTVDYQTGEILCESVFEKTAVYRASYAVPTETSYIEFENNVIWTEQN